MHPACHVAAQVLARSKDYKMVHAGRPISLRDGTLVAKSAIRCNVYNASNRFTHARNRRAMPMATGQASARSSTGDMDSGVRTIAQREPVSLCYALSYAWSALKGSG